MVDTLATLSAGGSAAVYYDRELLYRAQQAQVFYEAGQKKNLKKNSGKTISWRRYNALTVNTTTSTLVEGVTPTARALSQTEVTATAAQYGDFCEITDFIEIAHIDPIVMEAMGVMGQLAGETIETVVQDVIEAGTSVVYATGSSRGSQATTNVMTVALIRKGVRILDNNNTMRFNGVAQNKTVGTGHYVLFIHPNQVYDLKNDSEWKAMQQNSAPEKLYNGEIGEVEGCRIVQSTLAPEYVDEGSASADVFGAIMVGQHAFGVVDVAGSGKFKSVVKELGSAGTADPLNQRATAGWKSFFVSKILNNNFMVRIETGATDQT